MNIFNIAKFHPQVIDDFTGQVNGQIVNYLSSLASPGKAALSNWNKTDEAIWIVFEIILNTILII